MIVAHIISKAFTSEIFFDGVQFQPFLSNFLKNHHIIYSAFFQRNFKVKIRIRMLKFLALLAIIQLGKTLFKLKSVTTEN
jgi:hypothetical protein